MRRRQTVNGHLHSRHDVTSHGSDELDTSMHALNNESATGIRPVMLMVVILIDKILACISQSAWPYAEVQPEASRMSLAMVSS